MSAEDALLLIAALPASVADQLATRLTEAGVEVHMEPVDRGRGWEVQIYVQASAVAHARTIEARFIRDSVPDLPPDFDPLAARPTGACPACGTQLLEGSAECGDCGLVLPG